MQDNQGLCLYPASPLSSFPPVLGLERDSRDADNDSMLASNGILLADPDFRVSFFASDWIKRSLSQFSGSDEWPEAFGGMMFNNKGNRRGYKSIEIETLLLELTSRSREVVGPRELV